MAGVDTGRALRALRRVLPPASVVAAPALVIAACAALTACTDAPAEPSAEPTRTSSGTGQPPAAAPSATSAPATTNPPTPGGPDLVDNCPSIETLQSWARIDWVVDSIGDSLEGAGECDYLSVPYEPGSTSHAGARYVLTLSTQGVPSDGQLESFRAAAPKGGTLRDVEVAGAPALRHEDADGLACQVILATGELSTLLVLVSDPKGQMDDDCGVAERVMGGLLRPLA